MKRLLLVLAVLAVALIVLLGGLRVYYATSANARVAEEVRAFPGGERAKLVMLLSLPDGRELPVNYLREGDRVYAGADGRWWRAFRGGKVPVEVFIRGERLSGRARVVLDDPEYTRRVFERLRPKVPKWLPDWLDAKLVVIDLEQ